MNAQVIHGDCLEVLRGLPDNSVDAVVTDPPYGLSFMGRKWDYDVPSEEIWRECLRVLKPGGHLLAFAGTRTQHRMAVRIEDAGFEIRDMIAWVYSTGFPKSLDVSKALDKTAGAEREVIGVRTYADGTTGHYAPVSHGWDSPSSQEKVRSKVPKLDTAPTTPLAQQWQGWGTALKPALEPITVARKPLMGTVAANVQQWGTGALNIDGARIGDGSDRTSGGVAQGPMPQPMSWGDQGRERTERASGGRWPANLIHDGSEEVVALFPESNSSATKRNRKPRADRTHWRSGGAEYSDTAEYGDSGSAARFFYCAKASKRDRDEGNTHPTVKPTDLMRYLCRLVTPPGGMILDPFCGSGSTGKAALLEGFSFIGIEREAEYVEIARARIAAAHPTLLGAS